MLCKSKSREVTAVNVTSAVLRNVIIGMHSDIYRPVFFSECPWFKVKEEQESKHVRSSNLT